MYEKVRAYVEKAKRYGFVVDILSYNRVSRLSKAGETAIDVIGYAAQIAAQLGAHIIKVKMPSDYIEQKAARKVYESEEVPISTPAERVNHVVQCAFNGRRIVIFSGGATETDQALLAEIEAIASGGGFGSIIGRNSFQRSHEDAIELVGQIINIYSGKKAAVFEPVLSS